MSASKADRSIAPRVGTRRSRAKETRDRNVAPPPRRVRANKPKKGERAMRDQVAAGGAPEPVAAELVKPDPDSPPPDDPWWTAERERAFTLVLNGAPQHQVAAELDRDRHTVARWCEDERFVDRLQGENRSRFHASRQRRVMHTLRLTDKVAHLADKTVDKMLELAKAGKDDVQVRFATRDWLSEFREMSRREDEIYGLDKQRVDVNVHGSVEHKHSKTVNVSFRDFLGGAMRNLGVDVEAEEVPAARADEALVMLTERALMEGTFLDDLVASEKEQALLAAADASAR